MTAKPSGNEDTIHLCTQTDEPVLGNVPRIPEDLESVSPEAMRQMLRDLREHQRELETPNGGERERLRIAYVRQHEMFDKLIANAPVAIAVIQPPEFHYVLANQAYCAIAGLKVADVVGKTARDIFPEVVEQGGLENFDQVLLTGQNHWIHEYEVTLGPERRPTWWNVDHLPLFNGEGQVESIMILAQDVTDQVLERRQVEADRQILQAVLKYTHMMAAYLDTRFNFIWVNPAYAESCRHDPAFFPGKNHFDLYPHPENQAIFQRVADTGEPVFVAAKPFKFPDQPERGVTYWDWSLIPVKDAESRTMGLVFTLAEVTDRIRTEEALRAEKDKLDSIFRAAPTGIGMVAHRVFKDVNGRICEMTGYAREELIDRNARMLYLNEEEFDRVGREKYAQIMERGAGSLETQWRCKDGRIIDVLLSSAPIEPGNWSVGVTFTALDITERKQMETALRDSEETMRYIVKHDPNAIAVYDRNMHYIAVSDRFLQDYNVREEDIIGRHHYEVFPEMPQKWKDVHRRCLAGAIERNDDDCFERPDGSITYNRWECRPWRRVDGEIGGMIMYTEVTTERKRLENDLRAANRQKDEFLAMLAHELRNPLAPIRNANEVLTLTSANNPTIERQCKIINRQVGHMTRLIDDLLDVSRITQGKISLQKNSFDLREVLDQAIESTQDLFVKRQQTLTYTKPEKPIVVNGDFTRLVQVVFNLLLNANKYTDPGGRITIEVTWESARDGRPADQVVVSIRDTGIGISAADLAHVFDLFSQAEKTLDRSQGGLGIGLTLVKRLVEMHGGTTTVFSKGLGQGSEFAIHLPVGES